MKTATLDKAARKFTTVSLALNIGIPGGNQSECNPGGSTICTTGTKGCDAGLTCVGTSSKFGCFGGSDIGIDSRFILEERELKNLQVELQRVVAQFAAKAR